MKRFCFILSILYIIPTVAYADSSQISAKACVVIDANLNSVLYEKNMNEPLPMASTTKIMTCLLACENAKLDEVVTITDEMLDGTYGSLIYLKAGDKITVADLIKGALLASGNDAANSLAVFIAGSVSSFVDLMNRRAEEIGMKNTFFVTPSGLDDGNHHSTACDMAILTSNALKNEYFVSVCQMQSAEITISGKNQTIYNHNKLLGINKSCIGVKTGFTDKAGRCLVSAYKYNSNKIIIVTLNDYDDWNDHEALFKIAKSKYKKYKINKDIDIACVGGEIETVCCKAASTVYSINEPTIKMYYYPFVYSPVRKNDVVGRVEIYDSSLLLKTVDIIVRKDVKLWQTTK